MKVALVLTGYMRNWEDHFPNIYENIISKYSCDVFITTYTYSELYMNSEIISVDIDKVISYYKPKNYIFRSSETLPKFNFKKNGIEKNGREWSYRILRAWYNIYLSLTLFNPEDYDIIIKSRNDFSTKKFKLNPFKKLVFPSWKVHPGPCLPEESYVDYFAYGNSKYMKKYLEFYTKIQDIHDNDLGDVSIGETLIKSYVKNYIGEENITLDYHMDWKMRDELWASEIQEIYKKYEPSKVVTIEQDE